MNAVRKVILKHHLKLAHLYKESEDTPTASDRRSYRCPVQHPSVSCKDVHSGVVELLEANCQRWLKNAGFLYISELTGELKTSLILTF